MPDIDYGQILEALNDKVDLSGSWSAPTSQYDDLTLGDSASTYVAPADGWFVAQVRIANVGGTCRLTNVETSLVWRSHNSSANQICACSCPAKRGQSVVYEYSTPSSVNPLNTLKFVYAQKTN